MNPTNKATAEESSVTAPAVMVLTSSPEVLDAIEALPPGRIEPLPPGYIDPELQGEDLELLQTFYAACRAEGGTADEIHLRGLSAVLAARRPAPANPTSDSIGRLCDALAKAVRPDSGYRALTSDDLKSGEEITGGAGEQIVGVEWWLPQLGCDSLQQTLDSIKGRIIFAVRDWWKTAFVTTTLVDFPAETIKPPDPEVARPAAARCGGAAMSDTNRTPLSPAAQAVLDAAHEAWVTRDDPGSIAAAALRAAVDQVVPEHPMVVPGGRSYESAWSATVQEDIRKKFLAIAAELECQP